MKNMLSDWTTRHSIQAGSRVFLLKESRTNGRPPKIYEATIVSVGRQYVHTDMFKLRFHCLDPEKPYLTDADASGLANQLFPDQASLDKYLKREALAEKFRRSASRWASACTQEQLEAAINILDGDL